MVKFILSILRERVNQKWPLSGKIQVFDLIEGYFCFNFEEYKDLFDVWKGSPWSFDGKIQVLK